MQKKLSLMLHYKCNNNCIFCYCADKMEKGYSGLTTAEAKKEMEKGRDRGCDFIDFNGGEPSLRSDISELVSHAKEIGYNTIAMTTNGRRFYYKEFTEELIEKGLNHIIFSLHGHNAKLHDYMVQAKGAFRQTTTGMANILDIDPNFYISTNTTITKQNYKFLPQIAENNIRLGASSSEFIFVHPRGRALQNFEEIVPRLENIAPYIQKTIEVGEKHDIDHFKMRYLPLCYMINRFEYSSELTARSRLREQHKGPEFEDLNVEEGREKHGRVKAPFCSTCGLDKYCEGIFKEYAERRGFEELNPVGILGEEEKDRLDRFEP